MTNFKLKPTETNTVTSQSKNASSLSNENPNEKHDFFFTIHTFMTRDLGLRSSALIVYAIIYAFSADGKGTYFGNMDFLAEQGELGNSTVRSSIQSLLRDNFIYIVQGEKHESKHYSVTQSKLKLINSTNSGCQNQAPEALKSSSRGAEIKQQGAEIEQVGCQNRAPGVLKSSTNNKYYNKYNNNTIINSYNSSAAAQEKEKEEENNFKENKEIVIRTNEKREKHIKSVPLDVNDQESVRRYLASFIPESASHNGVCGKPYEPSSDTDKSSTSQNPDSFGCENGNDTSQSSEPSICESKSQASQDFAPRGYEKKHYISQSSEPSGYAVKNRYSYASSTAPAQTCKYGNFDPEEAFRAALARTEALFDELNANKKNED